MNSFADRLSVEQLAALRRVASKLAESGRAESEQKEEAFIERCRAKLITKRDDE